MPVFPFGVVGGGRISGAKPPCGGVRDLLPLMGWRAAHASPSKEAANCGSPSCCAAAAQQTKEEMRRSSASSRQTVQPRIQLAKDARGAGGKRFFASPRRLCAAFDGRKRPPSNNTDKFQRRNPPAAEDGTYNSQRSAFAPRGHQGKAAPCQQHKFPTPQHTKQERTRLLHISGLGCALRISAYSVFQAFSCCRISSSTSARGVKSPGCSSDRVQSGTSSSGMGWAGGSTSWISSKDSCFVRLGLAGLGGAT